MKRKWIVDNLRWIIIAMVILASVVISNIIISDIKHKQDIAMALAAHEAEELQGQNSNLLLQLYGYKGMADSLVASLKEKDKQLDLEKKKLAVISSKYAIERSRIKHLSNDSAVALFLDKSDCGEIPIVKYDSAYLIPIEPIRIYNDLAVAFDEQVDLNKNLTRQTVLYALKNKDLTALVENKNKQISVLETINSNSTQIIAEKDKQIAAEQMKYKSQKVKTIITGGVGLLLLTVSLVL